MSFESRLAAEELVNSVVASVLLPYSDYVTNSFREVLISRITDAMDASWLQGLEDGKLEDRFNMMRKAGREEETNG